MPNPSQRKRIIPERLDKIRIRHWKVYVRQLAAKLGGGLRNVRVVNSLIAESKTLKKQKKLTNNEVDRLATRLIEQTTFLADHLDQARIKSGHSSEWVRHYEFYLDYCEKNVPPEVSRSIRKKTIPDYKEEE